MKRILVLLLLMFPCIFCFAQEFEIINEHREQPTEFPKEFYFISNLFDESKGIKIADVKFYAHDNDNKNSLTPIFHSLWDKANSMGANAFFVSKVEYDSDVTKFNIAVELYFLNENEIEENFSLYPENIIVIMGNVNTSKKEKGKSFKLNKEKITLLPFEYIAYQNEVGETATISVGGFLGTMVKIKGEEFKLPVILSLGGLSARPMVGYGGGRISFSNGSITQMDLNLGLFLMDVLK